MRQFLIGLFVLSALTCSQKQELLGETPWQIKMNADFKDASKSPLKPKDLKKFKALDFFKFDSSYVVKANLKRTPDSEWFNMKTTTGDITEERIYGILSFKLNEKLFQLNVYQGKDQIQMGNFNKYLFLPFLDDTNGSSSYEGGRYINLEIPEGDTIAIDFNKAYNPYCAYNEKYSCPIVPRENYLATEIKAGVKAFKKH